MKKDRCWNCTRSEMIMSDYCNFCIEHDYCCWEYCKEKPMISFEEAIAYLEDSAEQLKDEHCSRKIVAERIGLIIRELKKMRV